MVKNGQQRFAQAALVNQLAESRTGGPVLAIASLSHPTSGSALDSPYHFAHEVRFPLLEEQTILTIDGRQLGKGAAFLDKPLQNKKL